MAGGSSTLWPKLKIAVQHNRVRLLKKVLVRSVVRTVVKKHKSLDSQSAIVCQKRWQEIHLVSEDCQQREAR